MKIRAGYEIAYECPQPTPMIVMLSVHPSRTPDLITPDRMRLTAAIPANAYRDGFGNVCHVIHAPAGRITLSADFLIEDSGAPDDVVPDAMQHSLEKLPVETIVAPDSHGTLMSMPGAPKSPGGAGLASRPNGSRPS